MENASETNPSSPPGTSAEKHGYVIGRCLHWLGWWAAHSLVFLAVFTLVSVCLFFLFVEHEGLTTADVAILGCLFCSPPSFIFGVLSSLYTHGNYRLVLHRIHVITRVEHWLVIWALFTFGFVLIGGVLGAVVFLLIGALTHPELELTYRLSKGFLNGAFYFGIWAGGLGIVLCVIRAHREGRFS